MPWWGWILLLYIALLALFLYWHGTKAHDRVEKDYPLLKEGREVCPSCRSTNVRATRRVRGEPHLFQTIAIVDVRYHCHGCNQDCDTDVEVVTFIPIEVQIAIGWY